MKEPTMVIHTTWRGTQTVTIPPDVDPVQAVVMVQRGELPEWLAEQLNSGGTYLSDWEVDV
jgi:hypothetical protein